MPIASLQSYSAALAVAVSLSASTFGVPPGELLSARRGRAAAAHGRQIAIYLAHVVLGLSISDLAAIFRRDRASVRHALARIEDRRDDPFFDLWLTALETCVAPFRSQTTGG